MEKDQIPFRVKAYAHLLSLNILSFAIAITDFTLILSILAYTFEVSSMEIGYATALYGLPGVIFGVFIGRFSDSRDPFIILYVSVFLKLIVAISLMFAPNVYFFIFMVFIKGIANTLGVAPGQFLLRAILNDKQLIANNSFMTVAFQLTKILAPLVIAAVILSMGMNSFLISVLLCLLSLPQIYFIKFYHRHIAKMRSSKAKASIFALYALLQEKKLFKFLFITSVVQTLVLSLYDSLFPLFLRSESFAASVFGMVISCTAIGGMVAGIIFPKFFKRKYALHLTSFSLFGFSLTILIPGVLAINGFSFQVYFLCLLWGFSGFFYTVTTLVFGTTMQIESPIESIGTITSSISSMQMAILVSGPIMGAMLSELTSISFVFILSGLIGLVFSVYSAVLTFQHRINGVS